MFHKCSCDSKHINPSWPNQNIVSFQHRWISIESLQLLHTYILVYFIPPLESCQALSDEEREGEASVTCLLLLSPQSSSATQGQSQTQNPWTLSCLSLFTVGLKAELSLQSRGVAAFFFLFFPFFFKQTHCSGKFIYQKKHPQSMLHV